jgi:hypothetical protein
METYFDFQMSQVRISEAHGVLQSTQFRACLSRSGAPLHVRATHRAIHLGPQAMEERGAKCKVAPVEWQSDAAHDYVTIAAGRG